MLQYQSEYIHSVSALLSLSTFLLTFYISVWGHYVDIVKTHVAGYPQEWFPSVSAVIGDDFPARSMFQYGMALSATPRFLSVFFQYVKSGDKFLLASDVLKTLFIGGFTYVTSVDHMTLHSSFMILYACASAFSMIKRMGTDNTRRFLVSGYFCNLISMSYFLYRHRVLREPGAYSIYAIFEWLLPAIDICYDFHCSMNLDVKSPALLQYMDQSFEIAHSVIFWTLLTGLPLSLWYFPLWKLGLSGYEVFFVASFFVPMYFVTGNPMKRIFPVWTLDLFPAMSMIAGSSESLDPSMRLFFISIGFSLSLCRFYERRNSSAGVVGLLATVLLKNFNNSVNPLWNTLHHSGLFRMVIIAIFGGATLHSSTRPFRVTSSNIGPISMWRSIAFGACLYSTQTFITDSQVYTTWLSGNSAVTHWTKFAMTLGMIAGLSLNWIPSWTPMMLFPTRVATLDVAKFTFAQTLSFRWYLDHHSCLNNYTNFLVVTGTYLFLIFADVFTVAYAFVPLGWIFREKSVLIMFIALSIQYVHKGQYIRIEGTIKGLSKVAKGFTWFLGSIAALRMCMERNATVNRERLVKITNPDILTTGIWTIHFGMDDYMYLSHKNMTDVVKRLDLDVIGLLESDTMRNVGGNRNLMEYMAKQLNMELIYGPPPNAHTWGCSLLSKYPVISSRFHLLPSPHGELACAVEVQISTKIGPVNIFVSHNGQEEDKLDRFLQTGKITDILDSLEGPTIFMGYLVTKPGMHEQLYNMMVTQGRMTDILKDDKWRWCQYIFYRDIYALSYARVSHGHLTDTEIQTAKFWIGGAATTINIPGDSMYPKEFEGEGYNGHRYHIWTGAIYDPVNFSHHSD